MALKAGTTTDLFNSMAKAMEDAFIAEWRRVKEGQAAPTMTEDMRLIFVAVAQGVVSHLQANANAFVVSTENGDGNHNHDISIDVVAPPVPVSI